MHSFKWKYVLIPILIIGILAGINSGLNYCLFPYTTTRVDVHNLETADYEQLIVGTSHGKCGIDPAILEEETGLKTINVCKGPEYPHDVYYLVKEAARTHEVKRVIYELDPGYLKIEPIQNEAYIAFYREMPMSAVKIEYFANVITKADYRTWAASWYLQRMNYRIVSDNLRMKQTDAYRNYELVEIFQNEELRYRENGFLGNIRPAEGNQLDADQVVLEDSAIWDGQVRKESAEYLQKLVELCRKEGIELVIAVLPIPVATYTAYRDNYNGFLDYIGRFCAEQQVQFLNYLNTTDSAISTDLVDYTDYEGHMYEDTAEAFSRSFGRDLSQLESE